MTSREQEAVERAIAPLNDAGFRLLRSADWPEAEVLVASAELTFRLFLTRDGQVLARVSDARGRRWFDLADVLRATGRTEATERWEALSDAVRALRDNVEAIATGLAAPERVEALPEVKACGTELLTFDDTPGWYFAVEETSAGVHRAVGVNRDGRSVDVTNIEGVDVLGLCRAEAKRLEGT